MNCPECGASLKDGQMLCPVCGAEIQLIPDFDPDIEKEIHDTLSELDVNIAADTQRLPDLDELRQTGGLDFIDFDMPYEYDDDDPESEYYDNGNHDGEDYDAGADRGRIAGPGAYTEEFATDADNGVYPEAGYGTGAGNGTYWEEDHGRDTGNGTYPENDYRDDSEYYDTEESYEEDEYYNDDPYDEEFDEEYDGDFLDELDDFDDEEDVVKQIALAIRESRFRWLYAVLLVAVIAGIGFAAYRISRVILLDNSAQHQAELAASAFAEADYAGAIRYMEKSLSLDSTDIGRKYTLVDYYFADGQDDKALLLLWEIIYAKDASSANAYQRVLNYYEERKDYAKIEAILSNCEDQDIIAQFGSYLANPPEFSIPAGTYDDVITLNISSNTNGTIYYTMDGTEPTTNSEVFTAPLTFELGSYTVKAIFVNSMGVQSAVAEARYTVYIRVPDAPVVFPVSDSYSKPVWITAFAMKYCTIHYTTDGTIPTMDSPQYTNPIPMPIGTSHFIFASYSQEGVLGETLDVQYTLMLDAEIEPQSVIDALRQYNINTGRTTDNYGHLPGSNTRYSYTVGYALTLPQPEQPEDEKGGAEVSVVPGNADIYYLVTENVIDSNEISMRTGNYYMCNIKTGELYKARRTDEMRYEKAELIPPEAFAAPEIPEIPEVPEIPEGLPEF